MSHVGFSPAYARALVRRVPGLSVSLLRFSLASLPTPPPPSPPLPLLLGGARFARDMRRRRVPLFAWTVNDEAWMRWAAARRLDGVITDDPRLFLDVCRRMSEEEEEAEEVTLMMGTLAGNVKLFVQIVLLELIHAVWMLYLFCRHGGPGRAVRKSLEGQ